MDTTITLTAHRGYRAKFPENTMLGFREALKLDIDSIEMDVHMTRDRQIVVMHDAALDRTTDKTGLIRNMTLAEVREADAGIKFGEQFKGEKVPTLDEFLALMATRPDIKVLLELKDYPEELGDFAYVSCEKTFDLLKKYGVWGRERLTVITFSTGLCAWMKTRYPFDEIALHGFWPKYHMRGWEKDDPYKYLDEVCLFNDIRTLDGRNIPSPTGCRKTVFRRLQGPENKAMRIFPLRQRPRALSSGTRKRRDRLYLRRRVYLRQNSGRFWSKKI